VLIFQAWLENRKDITEMGHLINVAARLPWWCKVVPKLLLPEKFWHRGTGGTDSARYCYSVWLRHLVIAHMNGLSTDPTTVAELGPGDSLGIGLAALLSGASSYYALDIVNFTNTERNLEVFDELVTLLNKRERIPDGAEFPEAHPRLDSYDFPAYILTDARLRDALDPRRVALIRATLTNLGHHADNQIGISYFAPWDDTAILKAGSVDLIYSQAVLEHVDELEHTYQTLYHWLKPGGVMSHQIDFRCHDAVKQWNGHWAFSDWTWRLMRGKRPYSLNREPHSTHLTLLIRNGFKVTCDLRVKTTSEIKRKQLARRFQSLTDEDLCTSSALIQAIK
jgi:SAM-dependent methyltransferase